MKNILLSALLLGSVAMASDYKYEVTPLIGYNFAEGNIDVDDHMVFGAEAQYNGFDYVIKPELSILYSKPDYDISGLGDTSIWRTSVNGVYEYEKMGSFTPLVKAGIGYESMSDTYTAITGNESSLFLDAGVGAKIPFTKQLALKLEAVYMLKFNDSRYDNNLAFLAGLNFAFGASAPKAAPVVVEEEVAVVIIDGDDDNDGVLNSQDSCIDTPAGVKVDALGCALPVAVVDNDTDKDGVINANDLCPNTPLGDKVNSDGCPTTVNLHINFEYNSSKIDAESATHMQKYADFLIKNTNYSAKIVGYTDSKGSESYNQKLSESRAQAVMKDLVRRGVSPTQLSAMGAGETNPIASNDTEEGRAANRRIEAELIRN